jgi:hypothetical protein
MAGDGAFDRIDTYRFGDASIFFELAVFPGVDVFGKLAVRVIFLEVINGPSRLFQSELSG